MLQVTCATGALMAGGMRPAMAAQADAPSAPAVIQEVVVTAERRETKLQTTPVAVTAITRQNLETNRIHTLDDLNNLAPGLNAQRSGSENTVQYDLRGVNSTAFLPGQSSGVATYIDGVYQGLHNGSAADLVDIQQIEVLRGPQGTLFGQNSNGGAISIITRLPAGEFHVREELTGGNFDQFRSKTRVDLPAFGPLTASVIFLHDQRRGDIRNLGAGTQWDFGPVSNGVLGVYTAPKYMGDRNTNAVGVNLRLHPTDAWDFIYRFSYTDSKFTDNGDAILGDPNNLAGSFPFFFPLPTYLAIPADVRSPITDRRPDATNNYFSLPFHQWGQSHSFTATWTPNETFRFRDIAAYQDVTLDIHSQLDAAAGGNPPMPGIPFTIQSAASWNIDSVFSNEFQGFLTTRYVNVTAGFYYYDDSISNGPRVEPGNCTSGACFTTNSTQPYIIAQGGALRSVIKTQSIAEYAQANVHITSRLDLQAGIRNTHDYIHGADNLSGVTVMENYHHDRATWLAGLNWRATDDVFLYFKASTGYIRGGELGGFNFNPETAMSYEGGIKAEMFRHTLQANLAIYDATYDDVQAAGIIPGLGPHGGGLTTVLSVGNARSTGEELEATWVTPAKGVTLSGTLDHQDYRWIAFNPTYLLFNGLTPAQMQSNVPEWTANFAFQYQGPETHIGHAVARVDVNWRSDQNLDISWYTPLQQQYQHVGGRALVNARVALADIPLGPVKTEVALWAKNLTDDRSPISALFIAYLTSQFQDARTFGIDVNFNF
jgi:iron complex outermembrane receptor protein